MSLLLPFLFICVSSFDPKGIFERNMSYVSVCVQNG